MDTTGVHIEHRGASEPHWHCRCFGLCVTCLWSGRTRVSSSCHLLQNIMQRLCSVQCWCPQTPSSVVALLSGSMWCREVGSVMTSPDLLADSYRDNDDYCFTWVYGFNLNKNECRNITHAATSARCDVGCFPSIRGLYYVYFKTSVMC